jgi:hypothetical protein
MLIAFSIACRSDSRETKGQRHQRVKYTGTTCAGDVMFCR